MVLTVVDLVTVLIGELVVKTLCIVVNFSVVVVGCVVMMGLRTGLVGL